MRIKELFLENITSLKNKHFINFERISKESDLFAITGPTGSGKSTILNSISMVLYGEHPKKLNALDMVSQGTPYGTISLKFDYGSDQYHATWSCQVLKKDGTPRSKPKIDRQLEKNGVLIESKIEDILGLNFDQFSKVVILNQGQFSNFLTASFTERKLILEKMMDHHDLSQLSIYLRKSLNALDNEKSALENQIQTTRLMTKEDYESLLKEKKTTEEEKIKLDDIFTPMQDLGKSLSESIELSGKLIKTQTRLTEQKAEANAKSKVLAELKAKIREEEKALKICQNILNTRSPVLKQAIEVNNKIKSLNPLLKDREESLTNLTQKVKLSKSQREEEQEKLKQTNLELIELKELVPQNYEELKGSIPKKIGDLFTTNEQVKNLSETNKNETHQLQTIEKEAKQKKFERANLLEKAKDLNNDFSGLENIKKTLEHFEDNEETVSTLREEERQLNHQIESLSLKGDEITLKLKEYTETLEGLNSQNKEKSESLTELELATEKLAQQEQIKRLNILAYKIIQEREDNNKIEDHRDIHDCPVCAHTLESEQITAIRLKTESASAKDENKYASFQEQIQDLKVTIKTNQNLIQEKTMSSQKLKEELIKLKKEHELKTKQREGKLGQIKELSTLSLEDYKLLKDLEYKLNFIDRDLQKLRDTWKNQELSLRKNQKEEEEKTEFQIRLITELSKALQVKDSENQIGTLNDSWEKIQASYQLYRSKAQTEQFIQSNLANISEKIQIEEAEYKRTAISIQEINQELTGLENILSSLEVGPRPEEELGELEKDFQQLREKLQATTKESNEIEVNYSARISQIEILGEQLSDTEKLLALYQDRFKKASLKLTEFNFGFLNLTDDFERQIQKLIEIDNVPDNLPFLTEWHEIKFLTNYEALKKTIDANRDKLTEQRVKIETHLKQEDRVSQLKKAYDRVSKIHSERILLNEYIGKDAFRDFALSVLEESLIELANTEIEALADGRYNLVHAKAGKKSEFLVKDFWAAGSERKVSTLSGGETFLLSLGLALGLSEMSRGQTEIDSFFIDEGFGTLDEESITQVLDCLMAMQSRGKQIGLISHVKNLTEQIPVKINLQKNNFGESQIELS